LEKRVSFGGGKIQGRFVQLLDLTPQFRSHFGDLEASFYQGR
jgi:hypothetical protein